VNIPNLLTTIRFFLVPAFGYYVYERQYLLAVIIFTIAGLTDILDGFIARKYNLITPWGKLADPAADKLMQLTALFMLNMQGKIPRAVVIIILVKEVTMIVGSFFLYSKNKVVVQANWYGKLSTVILYVAIVMILFNIPFHDIFIFIALLFMLFSFFMYAADFLKKKNNKSDEA